MVSKKLFKQLIYKFNILIILTWIVSCGSSGSIFKGKGIIVQSQNVMYMRDTSDTLTVNTRCTGWIADSIRISEWPEYLKEAQDRTYRFSEKDRAVAAGCGMFGKRIGWLAISYAGKEITFIV